MLVIVVHRVLDVPAVSVRFEPEPAYVSAWRGWRVPQEPIEIGYWQSGGWPHEDAPVSLVDLCDRALDACCERLAENGGWTSLV